MERGEGRKKVKAERGKRGGDWRKGGGGRSPGDEGRLRDGGVMGRNMGTGGEQQGYLGWVSEGCGGRGIGPRVAGTYRGLGGEELWFR